MRYPECVEAEVPAFGHLKFTVASDAAVSGRSARPR